METGERDKKFYYIAGIIGILGLLLIIGLWRNYFENEVKKDKAYTALIKNGKAANATTKTSGANDVSQPKRCCIDVNAIYSLGLSSFEGHSPTQEAADIRQNTNKDTPTDFTLRRERSHYILAGVVLTMVGYIGYFLSQKYSLDWTRAKDTGILFLVMPLLSFFIIDALISRYSYPVICCLVSNIIGYSFVRWLCLRGLLFNNEPALLRQGWSFDMQCFYSACVLAYLYYEAHINLAKYNAFIVLWLLWCIQVAFLYVKAYWSPQLFSPFSADTKTLWTALGFMALYDVIVSNWLNAYGSHTARSNQTPK